MSLHYTGYPLRGVEEVAYLLRPQVTEAFSWAQRAYQDVTGHHRLSVHKGKRELGSQKHNRRADEVLPEAQRHVDNYNGAEPLLRCAALQLYPKGLLSLGTNILSREVDSLIHQDLSLWSLWILISIYSN